MKSVRWMAKNHVTANLLMILLLLGGYLASQKLKVEILPEVELERVLVTVAYPGASPEEVEAAICLPIEEAVSGINQVRRLQSSANEGSGSVVVELIQRADVDYVLQDVKAAVDRIVTFPQEAERPVVQKVIATREVLSISVHGPFDTHVLNEHAERARDDLLALPEITQVEIVGVPPPEIAVEISEQTLRRHSLTLGQVASMIKAASVDLPGGGVRTRSGEVLLYTKERRYLAREYEDVVVVSRPDGSLVRLGHIATLKETFAETDQAAHYNSDPAILIQVGRIGDETPLAISRAVNDYLERTKKSLPPSLQLSLVQDQSETLRGRINLLLKNLALGLVLVVCVLGLFLEGRLAFWVTMGIPISVLGAFIFISGMNVSINLITLFAFILVLGIVVDDAIVVGENAHAHQKLGKPQDQAVADGAIEVGRPVIFSVLTTMAAFAPLLFATGMIGKFMYNIPVIVISVLVMSLIESLYILPAHLSGKQRASNHRNPFTRLRQKVAIGLERFIDGPYQRILRWVLAQRYITLALCVATLTVTLGFVYGGYIKQVFMPEIEGDFAIAKLTMPFGTSAEITARNLKRLEQAANETIAEYNAQLPHDQHKNTSSTIVRGIFSVVGELLQGHGPSRGEITQGGGHIGSVAIFLKPIDERNVSTGKFKESWVKRTGEIAGAESLEFDASIAHMGAPIGVQLAHTDFAVLEQAANKLKETLGQYAGVYDIIDNNVEGKPQLELKIRPEARSLGLTERDLANQVRSAFYGAEALRLQRDRNEVKVMVRYPLSERRTLADAYAMRIRAADGSELPLARAAEIREGHSYSKIERTDRKRTITVKANVHPHIANSAEILQEIWGTFLPQLAADYPGLTFEREGESREWIESFGSLKVGLLAALVLIYALLAIPFRSYSQPLLIMIAIPFAMIGALIGHLLLGYSLSMMSLFGLVALTGVVVNDSLVLVDFVNRNVREKGQEVTAAVLTGCRRRFRPILLTTLTTFFALLPMLAETSVQAQFLIPMAISLAFGVLFATVITLIFMPALYVILEDIKSVIYRFFHPQQKLEE